MKRELDDVGDLRLATVVVNVTDMERAEAFWCAALGYRKPDRKPDAHFSKLTDPAGQLPSVLLQRTDRIPPEPTPVHIDLYTRNRDEHIDRLLTLGATRATNWPYPPEPHGFVVLHDPDGNEFCIIQTPD